MRMLNSFIEQNMLTQVDKDNYFTWKRAFMQCKANVFFLAFLLLIITPVHCLDFEKHPLLAIGDIVVVLGLISSILLLKNGNVFGAGMFMVIAFMMIPLIQNLIGDWLYPNKVSVARFFETVVMLCFLFTIIIIYATNEKHIVVGAVLSIPTILGHFVVLRNVVSTDIPYSYLLYVLLPIAVGIIASRWRLREGSA